MVKMSRISKTSWQSMKKGTLPKAKEFPYHPNNSFVDNNPQAA
jgi:hypothetical protein